MVDQAVLFVNVGTGGARIANVTKPRPIVHVPARFSGEEEEDGRRAGVIRVTVG